MTDSKEVCKHLRSISYYMHKSNQTGIKEVAHIPEEAADKIEMLELLIKELTVTLEKTLDKVLDESP